MLGNGATEETSLLGAAIVALRDRLPESWGVELGDLHQTGPDDGDAAVVLRAPSGTFTQFAAEAKRELAPRAVPAILPKLARTAMSLSGNVPLLIVSPWLSPRTRELLTAEGINYVDLTGNVRVQLDHPALFISSDGATRDPRPGSQGAARVRGPKAGRLIRTLIDVRPPYGVRDLARAAGLAPGYVSRMLDTLHREGLVERDPRGGVLHVHIARLLDRWTEHYDVLRSNDARGYVSRAGAASVAAALARLPDSRRTAVTGSFAAYRIAPVAAPAQLFIYCEDPEHAAATLPVLPADVGADVVLLRPFDEVVWGGVRDVDGIGMVAPSQVAADCLTGTGRMPAEGEAVVEWMEREEQAWRRGSLGALD